MIPRLAQPVSRHFRLSIASENTFFVPAEALKTLLGHEIGEVPNMLADDERTFLQDALILLNKLDLKLFGKHRRGQLVEPGDGIRAELGKHDRLLEFIVIVCQIARQFGFDRRHVGDVRIPADVAIDANDVGQLRDLVFGGADPFDDHQREFR